MKWRVSISFLEPANLEGTGYGIGRVLSPFDEKKKPGTKNEAPRSFQAFPQVSTSEMSSKLGSSIYIYIFHHSQYWLRKRNRPVFISFTVEGSTNIKLLKGTCATRNKRKHGQTRHFQET